MNFTYNAKSATGERHNRAASARTQSPRRGNCCASRGCSSCRSSPAVRRQHAAPVARCVGNRRITSRDLMALTSQLAVMARAGMDIAGALESLARQCGASDAQEPCWSKSPWM